MAFKRSGVRIPLSPPLKIQCRCGLSVPAFFMFFSLAYLMSFQKNPAVFLHSGPPLQNAAAVFFDTCLTLSYNPRLVVKVCFYLTICETADFAVNYRSKGE